MGKKKMKTLPHFSTLKAMSTPQANPLWLASLLITGDIYFDNYRVESFFLINILRIYIYLSYHLCMN